jgi:pimeloyl-ACP methyl ester carboxylesterase
VHGGGHGGWCYQRVARLLRAAGHEVYAPTLTGLGERAHLLSPQVDLEMHIRDVAAVMEYEDLREVILTGHSYGGMVITGAAGRAADRVSRLVYLDAANPKDGQSLVDVSGGYITWTRQFGKVVDGVELVLLPETSDVGLMYGVTDPGDAAWMTPKLTGHPWRCFEQPRGRTAVGHRHRPRPDDHRAPAGGRRALAGRRPRRLVLQRQFVGVNAGSRFLENHPHAELTPPCRRKIG